MVKDGMGSPQRPWIGCWAFSGVVSAAFALVLLKLYRLSLGSELESYIPLIPFISVYLLYLKHGMVVFPGGMQACRLIRRSVWSPPSDRPSDPPVTCKGVSTSRSTATMQRTTAAVLWAVSAGLLVVQFVFVSGACGDGVAGALVLPVVAFVTAIIGGAVFFLGLPAVRISVFPWLFLYAMTPIPEPVAHALRVVSQQGSAETAYLLFGLTGTPVLREGLTFCLPGLTIQVAEECSGIHSSLVLLITSLVAGHLFLRNTSSRALLALMVIPVGLLRNGVRVVTLALLTIHVDSGIIDGPLHHKGGPVFFLPSLGVLVAILWGLRRYEKRRSA